MIERSLHQISCVGFKHSVSSWKVLRNNGTKISSMFYLALVPPLDVLEVLTFLKLLKNTNSASNIAAKLNTKLSSTIAKAEAWRSSFKLGDSDIAGIPWGEFHVNVLHRFQLYSSICTHSHCFGKWANALLL